MSDNADVHGRRKISSLRDLPQDLAPPRDLWQGIEARIAADKNAAVSAPAQRSGVGGRSARTGLFRVLAAAAVIVALAVGIWIGRVVLPVPGAPAAGAGS